MYSSNTSVNLYILEAQSCLFWMWSSAPIGWFVLQNRKISVCLNWSDRLSLIPFECLLSPVSLYLSISGCLYLWLFCFSAFLSMHFCLLDFAWCHNWNQCRHNFQDSLPWQRLLYTLLIVTHPDSIVSELCWVTPLNSGCDTMACSLG